MDQIDGKRSIWHGKRKHQHLCGCEVVLEEFNLHWHFQIIVLYIWSNNRVGFSMWLIIKVLTLSSFGISYLIIVGCIIYMGPQYGSLLKIKYDELLITANDILLTKYHCKLGINTHTKISHNNNGINTKFNTNNEQIFKHRKQHRNT